MNKSNKSNVQYKLKVLKKEIEDLALSHLLSINNESGTCAAKPIEVPKLTVESLKDAVDITKNFIQLDNCELEYLHIKLLNNKGIKDDKEK